MDITELDTTGPANDGAKMEVRLPNGAIALKPDETPVTITLLGKDSDAYQKVSNALTNRALRARGQQPVTAEGALTEHINLLAKVTLGWDGLTEKGEPLPFTEDNARRLYRLSPALREQVTDFVNDRGNFSKG